MAYPTNPIYKLVKDISGTVSTVKKQTGTSEHFKVLQIPFSEGNRHYQEYKKWVAEGNTAEEAD